MEQFAQAYPQSRRFGARRGVKPRHLMFGLLGMAAAGACWLMRS